MAKAVKPKTPVKKTAKPSGPEEVAELISKTKHPLKKTMEALREIILSVNKGITEHIKWNAPSFCFKDDDRITFNLHKNDCIMIVFHTGAKVKGNKRTGPLFKDTTGLLDWVANDRAVVKLYSLEEVTKKKASLKKVVGQWIKETTM
ncbi:MAG: DUF1801 domain-containing protein [Chitinophagaceae bacterium]